MPDDGGHPKPREVFASDETPSGTTAFLHALMSMLGEVLDRVDGRLSSLETKLAAGSEREPEGITNAAVMARLADLSGSVDDVGRRLTGLTALGEGITGLRDQVAAQGTESAEERSQEMTNVVAVLERLSERLERLEAREPPAMDTGPLTTRMADLSASLDDIGRRLAGLADMVTASTASTEADREGRGQETTHVLAALERLGQRIEQLEAQDPARLGLERAVSRLDELAAAVDSIGYGMAGMADLLSAPAPDGQQEWPEGLRAALLALGEGVVELRQDLQVHPVAELRITVRRLEGQLTLLTNQLTSQPGPGAAMAMVAAGLAERFEERTDALTELLGAHAAYVRQTWERIEGALDGGSFDELAVGEALEHVIDNQQLMAESVERVIVGLEDLRAVPRPSGDGLAREALETLGAGMEAVGVRVDDVRRRLAALARMLEASSQEKGPDTRGPGPTEVAGQRPPTPGRRLASDLGLRGRGRAPRRPVR